MSKFNRAGAYTRKPGQGPITTEPVASGLTHEGGEGFKRDKKSELFLMAVSSFFGEDTYYESAKDRDERFKSLVRTNTLLDPEWTAKFLRWLRRDGNIRTASLVGAVEFYRARTENKDGNPQLHDGLNRQVVNDVLVRADEPGEMLAYYMANYGKSFGGGFKRGIADAVNRLYNEYTLLKWDSKEAAFRFGDVIDLVHPKGNDALYKYALDRRHGRKKDYVNELSMINARKRLYSLPVEERRKVFSEPWRFRDAGMTWESLSGWLQGPMDAAAWEAIIPQMGYMALLRNLRNFDEAGISREAKMYVASILSDPAQVAKSRQFPFRFVAAYENAPSQFWTESLNEALTLSLKNIPELQGRSLVLVDTSGSMSTLNWSRKSKMSPVKAAAIFGCALAKKNPENVDLAGFANYTFKHGVRQGAELLSDIERFVGRIGEVGHGTQFDTAIAREYNGHDRIFMISDMQTFPSGYGRWDNMVPDNIPIYGFNLGGYSHGAMPTGPNRQEFGGLTDATFRQIPLLEAGKNGQWPWE